MNKKIVSQIEKKLPSSYWLRLYNRKSWLAGDLLSGLTIALILIPQSLAYIKLANLPIQYGLYASFLGPIIYCFFSTNKNISFGPTAVISLTAGSVIKELVEHKFEIEEIVPTLSFLVAITLLLLGLFKAGTLINLIPHPVNMGFTSAVAVIIMISQVPNLLGLKLESDAGEDDTMDSVYQILTHLKSAKHVDSIIGFGSLISLVTIKFVSKKYEKLRYLGILSNTVVMVVFTLLVMAIDFNGKKQIHIIKNIPRGIQFETPKLEDWDLVKNILKRMFSIVLVVIIEHSSVCKYFTKKQPDINQELIAIGMSNLGASFFGGLTSGGSFCRSAVQAKSGSNTPVTSVVTGVIILFTVLLLTPLFYFIPYATLSAVIIIAVVHLIAKPTTLKKLWLINKIDLLICLASFVLTLALGITRGIFISTLIAFADLLYKLSFPKFDVVDPIDDQVVDNKVETENLKGLVIIRPSQSMLFCNSDYLVSQFIKHITKTTKPHPNIESQDWKHNKEQLNSDDKYPYLKAVILDFISVDKLDSSGVQAIMKLKNYLEYYMHRDNVAIHFVNLKSHLQNVLLSSDIVDDIDLFNGCDLFEQDCKAEKSRKSIVVQNNIHDSILDAIDQVTNDSKYQV